MMDRRVELAHKIVELDLQLIAKMDEMKTETIRELKRTVETSQQIGAFDAPVPGARRAMKQV
jgi:hypothetical protein